MAADIAGTLTVVTGSPETMKPPGAPGGRRRGPTGAARGPRAPRGWLLLGATAAATLVASPVAAQAADPPTQSEEERLRQLDPSLSLDPSAPQAGALPGGMTPAYGQSAEGAGDWRFDFHGQFTMPMNVGIAPRADRQPGESERVLHAPPVIPGDKETFTYTATIPTPYVQLNLSYGNSVVTGNISLLAEQASVSAGYFDPPSQAGINDVFLDIRPEVGKNARLHLYVGAFTSRYGSPGEHDEGRYGTPIIARVNGVGEAVVATLGLSQDFALLLEQGIVGQSNKAPPDLTPDGWNDFADPNVGSTFAHHGHAGLAYQSLATLGAHYVYALSQDDTATGMIGPDGSVRVLGADLRLNLGRFGHLYGAVAQTSAEHARVVSRVIEVLNTRGGDGLIENYLGPQSHGNGTLLSFGGQYDLSVGKLVSYPVPFSGDGPDIFVSLFALGTRVTSDDSLYDEVLKLKLGAEATYSLLSWFAVSGRFDQVNPDQDDRRQSFMIFSPRLIFRTDWQASNQVMLQYSRFVNGSAVPVRTGYPPTLDPDAVPDENVISLSGSMWW